MVVKIRKIVYLGQAVSAATFESLDDALFQDRIRNLGFAPEPLPITQPFEHVGQRSVEDDDCCGRQRRLNQSADGGRRLDEMREPGEQSLDFLE
jgi:hypothetical protein